MCNFFSCIVTKDGRVLFTERDSHEEIIRRGRLHDKTVLRRNWVRVEAKNGIGPVTVDELGTVPDWYTEDQAVYESRVLDTAAAMASARKTYDAAVVSAQKTYDAALASAQKTYDAAIAPARKTYDAAAVSAQKTYDAAVASAWKIAPAWKTYEAAVAPIQKTYDAAIAPARKTYNAAVVSAQKTYDTALALSTATYIEQLRTIDGYLPI